MEAVINHTRFGDTKTIVFSLLLLLSISFFSCASVPKYVRNAFHYCHSDKDTGIESLINTEGYYEILYTHPKTGVPNEGGYSFMFYRNGLFTINLPRKYDPVNKQYNTSLGLQEIVENTNKEATKWFYFRNWGNYTICKDTIKVQYLDKPMLLTTIMAREEWFIIVDRNTLIPINSMPLSTRKTDWQNYEYNKYIRDEQAKHPAKFVPVRYKPSPDEAWILKEKWFWCSEWEWKAFNNKNGRK